MIAAVLPIIGRSWGKGRARKQKHGRGSNSGEGGGAADRKLAQVQVRPDGLAERPKVM